MCLKFFVCACTVTPSFCWCEYRCRIKSIIMWPLQRETGDPSLCLPEKHAKHTRNTLLERTYKSPESQVKVKFGFCQVICIGTNFAEISTWSFDRKCVFNRHFISSGGLPASRKRDSACPVHLSGRLDIHTGPLTRVLGDTWGCISLTVCLYRSRLLWWEETGLLSPHIWWIYTRPAQLWMQSPLVTSMLLETEQSFMQIPTNCHNENKRLL